MKSKQYLSARSLAPFFIFAISTHTCSYELTTHAKVTEAAYNQSGLGSGDTLKRLGLDVVSKVKLEPFGQTYFDFIGLDVRERKVAEYLPGAIDIESKRIPGASQFRPQGWLIRGTIREDDYTPTALGLLGDYPLNPLDDPFGNTDRVFNHFYDPVNNRPLTIIGISAGDTSVKWAVGADNPFAISAKREPGYRNHFSLMNTREAIWRALTLKGQNDDGSPIALLSDVASVKEREALSKTYWATVFRSLGDAVHLIQDAAQPQHTRNEAHSGAGPSVGEFAVTGHQSTYEAYIESRAEKKGEFVIDLTGNGFNKAVIKYKELFNLILTGYPSPTFNRFSDYFSTQPGGDVNQGKGLADYSNRGFFTAAKNFGQGEYSQPPSNLGYYELVSEADPDFPSLLKTERLLGEIRDVAVPTLSAPNASAPKKPPMSVRGFFGGYSLDKKIYDASADLLLPRAVGYSAGLINYFFRGTLTINRPSEGVFAAVDHSLPENDCVFDGTPGRRSCGFKKIKMKLKNSTADIVTPGGGATYPQHMTGGQLYAIAKYHNNPCFNPSFQAPAYAGKTVNEIVNQCRSVEESITLSDLYSAAPFTLNSGEEKELTFTFNDGAIPFSATDLYIQVVYRGKLGSEDDAVVVGTYDVSEPTFVTVANYLDVKINAADHSCAFQSSAMPQGFNAKLYVQVNNRSDPDPVFKELLTARLEPAQYVRLAFIGDSIEVNMRALAFYDPNNPDISRYFNNGIPRSALTILDGIFPAKLQLREDGYVEFSGDEYKVREGYGVLWGSYNSRFDVKIELSQTNVVTTTDDIAKAIQNCPGTMALQRTGTLAF
jgi:hypothetical protein